MPMDVDSFLDAVKAALIAEGGVPEITDANSVVWHHGEPDPDEDIKKGIAACKGVHVLIYDLGGDNADDKAGDPIIDALCAVELYVDTTKRNRRKTPALRLAGEIRNDIMVTLHRNTILNTSLHCQGDATVRGYKPLADPDYTAYRITVARSIFLDQ
jgi:hypothetical protein